MTSLRFGALVAFGLALGAVALAAPPSAPAALEPCAFGRVRMGPHCCWPGQDVGTATSRCVGRPSSCPAAMVLTDGDCVCEPGKVLVSGHCCWPGQDFGASTKACVGKPTVCPSGRVPAVEGCITVAAHARREGMVLVPAATVELAAVPGSARSGPVAAASFQIDEGEVTAGAYMACVRAGACAKPGAPTETKRSPALVQEPLCNARKPGRESHPMNCVSRAEAEAYCAWKKKRLPTEEEWQAAAEGGEKRPFPWGNDAPADRACWDGPGSKGGAGKRANTCATKSFASGKSAQGAFDLAGNVWEWTSSCLDAACNQAIARGGAWFNETPGALKTSLRQPESPAGRSPGLGFRCAKSVE